MRSCGSRCSVSWSSETRRSARPSPADVRHLERDCDLPGDEAGLSRRPCRIAHLPGRLMPGRQPAICRSPETSVWAGRSCRVVRVPVLHRGSAGALDPAQPGRRVPGRWNGRTVRPAARGSHPWQVTCWDATAQTDHEPRVQRRSSTARSAGVRLETMSQPRSEAPRGPGRRLAGRDRAPPRAGPPRGPLEG